MTEESFDTMSAYRSGIQRLLAMVSSQFDIFDPDLIDCGLETERSIANLSGRLSDHPRLQVRVLVHDPRHIEQNCPRLLALCRLRSSQIHIHVTAPYHRNWLQPFVQVDGKHIVTRFHIDSSRGKLCLDDTTLAAAYLAQFETLFQASTPGPNGAYLGI